MNQLSNPRRRRIGTPAKIVSLRTCLLAVLLAALQLGSDAGRSSLAGEGAPVTAPAALTALEAGPFNRADLVIVGHVRQVTDIQAPGGALGRQVVRIEVQQVFKGSVKPKEEISLLVHGQRPTLDQSRPSVPYFAKGRHDHFILFLGRGAQQHAYALQTLFDLNGSLGAEKFAAVKLVADSAAISDRDLKASSTLAALMKLMRATGGWSKTFAARELNYFAGVRPEAIDQRTRKRLRRTPQALLTPDQRHWLQELFKTLERAALEAKQGRSGKEKETDPWRVTFLRAAGVEPRQILLTRLVKTGGNVLERQGWWAWLTIEPSLRIWFVGALVSAGRREQAARLRSLYGSEVEPEVREAIVRGIGILGGDTDVTWLKARVQNVQLSRPALLALARIRSPKALAYIEEARTVAAQTEDKARAAWLEYLLSPAFEKSERRAGRGK